jgi:gliding motility-associated protein GldL
LSLAAAQMESLNSLYQVQVESASRQAEINTESIENAGKLKEQMESLATNLSSLNGVYGGMLSAMNKN